MNIDTVMTRNVRVCHSSDDLTVPARLMWECCCGAIPVVDEAGSPIAMITDRDICMAAFLRGEKLRDIHVQAAMSKNVVVCCPDDTLQEVETAMEKHRVQRLPVVSPAGTLIGIVSLSDVANALDAAHHRPWHHEIRA